MAKFFKKNNQISPINVPESPPVKKQNYVHPTTPRSINSDSSSENSISSKLEEDMIFYVIVANGDVKNHGNQLVQMAKQGFNLNEVHYDASDAYEAATSTNNTQSIFTIHKIIVPHDGYSIEENIEGNELYIFDTLKGWASAKIYTPNAPKGINVNPSEMFISQYVVLPGNTTDIINSADHQSANSLLSVNLFSDGNMAFAKAREKYPRHALTLIEMSVPLTQKRKETAKIALNTLLENTIKITSFSQSHTELAQGKPFALSPPKSVEVIERPGLRKK